MATRERRRQGGAVCTALLAMAFLLFVPLLGVIGVEGPSGTTGASVTAGRGAASAVFGPHADSRDSGHDPARDVGRDSVRDRARDGGGGRGCHEGENSAPREALPAPERTGSPTFDAAPMSYEPRDDAPALPDTSPPDATSVDLYRTQVIRT
jgi:hypothetical protein